MCWPITVQRQVMWPYLHQSQPSISQLFTFVRIYWNLEPWRNVCWYYWAGLHQYGNRIQVDVGIGVCIAWVDRDFILIKKHKNRFHRWTLLKEDIKKKTAEIVKLASFTLPFPPCTEREAKTKEWNIGIFETPPYPPAKSEKFGHF